MVRDIPRRPVRWISLPCLTIGRKNEYRRIGLAPPPDRRSAAELSGGKSAASHEFEPRVELDRPGQQGRRHRRPCRRARSGCSAARGRRHRDDREVGVGGIGQHRKPSDLRNVRRLSGERYTRVRRQRLFVAVDGVLLVVRRDLDVDVAVVEGVGARVHRQIVGDAHDHIERAAVARAFDDQRLVAIDEAEDRIYVQARGLYAVEEYLQARYYMFRQVYFHRTLRSAEAVLRSIMRRAVYLLDDGQEVWHAPATAFEKILRREVLNVSEHMQVDDSDFVFHIKQWQNSSDEILRDLSRRFISRRLFKAVDLDMRRDQQAEFLASARQAIARAGFDPDYYFIEDRASDVPYYNYYETEKSEPKSHIYVESGYASPEIREISEVSEVVRGLQHAYELHRVCFPAEVKTEVYELYHRGSSRSQRAG